MPDSKGTDATPARPPGPAPDLTGRTLGEYEILRRIGAGGMGQVYLARQLSLKRQVALKLLRHDLAADPTALKRFQAEAEAVATLNHPNIVQVYGAGVSEGIRYMALEYVEGRNLRDHLARKGPPELTIALSIMRQVATALQKAHDQGLVHRDIKPENILVTKKVEVKVTDFGLSRFFTSAESLHLTQSGITLGTPLYLSPEQAQGHAVDHRSDLYSFGVTCYHLLAGEPPFRGTTAVEVALKHITAMPRPLADHRPDLPADLCGMIHKLMAKKTEDRYQGAREVLRDLARVKEGLGLALTQPTPAAGSSNGATPLSLTGSMPAAAAVTSPLTGTLPLPPARKGRWLLAGLACLIAAAVGVATQFRNHPPAEPTAVSPLPPVSGMPDVRSPEKPVTTRERELVAILDAHKTRAEDRIAASIELGLLLIREGRLDEARDRFDAMEKEPINAAQAPTIIAAAVAARFGKAIVMAYRDNDPQYPAAAKDSLKLFGEAMASPLPRAPKAGDRFDVVRLILLRHPDLAQAVADALNRDLVNTSQTKLNAPLEGLRWPRGVNRKD